MAINSLKLIGKTSNEIFLLRYPNSLLDFCDFNFSSFADGAIDICNEALKTGTPDYDRISDLRHDIQPAHCYIEHNIRTTYETIVFDCWIDYVCRRDSIGVSQMWTRYILCKTPFEKAIFARLSEFRYNRAVNEWVNLTRIQDYAKTKLEFIFTENIHSIDDAAARRSYFDLIFSVTAREMGCRLEDLGVTKIFSVGRIPTAPFMFPNLSKEIVRHVLSDFDYSSDYSNIGDYTELTDQIAMDAFARMKSGLPQELEKFNIPNGKLEKYTEKIYMPCSLKAAVDLEIDMLIESGSWLSRCKRCKRFFLRNSEHPEEYCSRFVHNGKTCLQIYEEEHPRPTMTPELEERCRAVTDEMYSRVDKTMSVKEYDSWHLYLEAMINKVKNGEIPPSELENFLDYSLEVDISKSRPIVEVAKKEPETSGKRVVKPFVPERISRSELTKPVSEPESEEEPEPQRRPQSSEGFFTSPNFQRQKSERAPISHIIRNGESMGESYNKKPDPAGFTPFGAPESPELLPSGPQPVAAAKPEEQPKRTPISLPVREEPRRRTPREELKLLEERIEEENRVRRELAERSRSSKSSGFKPFSEPEQSGFTETFPTKAPYDRDERAEYYNTETKGYGSFGTDRQERDQYPQSRRERERNDRRRQEQPRQSSLSIAGYGAEDFERVERTERPERLEHDDRSDRELRGERGLRLNDRRGGSLYNRDIYGDAEELDESVVRDGRGSREPIRLHRNEPDEEAERDTGNVFDASEREESAAPRRKVIRKNAAALSAYGKMSGTQFSAAPLERAAEAPSKTSDIYDDQPDTEPFKDIGSIFDVIEQSQNSYEEHRRLTDDDLADNYSGDYSDNDDPEEELPEERRRPSERGRTRRTTTQRSVPSRVTEENVPDGIWTEERNLFPDTQDEDRPPEAEQTDSGRETRHTRSNKTQRLFDVIMREPDDNPNFRK